jgi:hypothetical protein
MRKTTKIARRVETFLLLALLAAVLGCGNKVWPRAQAAQDIFSWDEIRATRTADCATVSGTLRGGFANLEGVAVQVEELAEEPCLGCPFSPGRVLEFGPTDPALSIRGPHVSLLVCGLDPNRSYRLRLVGRNIYMTLGRADSEVLFLPANERS